MQSASNVILYHQDGCPMCKAVELQLKKKNIEFTSNKDIEEMRAKGILHTPVLEVDGTMFIGKDIINWIKEQ